jgi:predicted enzyme related to lactoylglutathione lyase
MIQVKEIPFVCYPTTDRARACAFYEGLLGLKPSLVMEPHGQYYIEYDAGAETLCISDYWKPGAEPKTGPVAALEVGDYEKTMGLLKENGVTIIEECESSVCFMSMVADPDGNSLWIHKRKGAPVLPEIVTGIPFICYPVHDRQRAYDFCEKVLNLTRTQPDYVAPDGFWSEYNIGTGTLALCNFWKPPTQPGTGPAMAFEVTDFDAAVAELKALNLTFVMEPMETPICFLSFVMDTEGNSFFVHMHKPKESA